MYAGCVLLRRVSPTWFHLENNAEIGTSLRIHGGQLDAYLEYNTMLRMGEKKLTVPIGYVQFARIFNSAPGVRVNFVYIEGNETLMGSGARPDREEFKVSPRDLYSTRQVAPRGSQVLSPSRAGIMTQMLWRNAESASRGRRDGHISYEDNLGVERIRGKRQRYDDHEFHRHRETSVAASSSGVTDDLNNFEFDDLTPPPDDPPTVPAPIPTFSSAQDQVMKDTTSGSGPIPKTRGASAKEKGKSKD
jgi:hypothetical protein